MLFLQCKRHGNWWMMQVRALSCGLTYCQTNYQIVRLVKVGYGLVTQGTGDRGQKDNW